MISREEAKGMLFSFMVSEVSMRNYSFEATIDEIFDSVGSCSECKYYVSRKVCKIHSEDSDSIVVMMGNDFCSYFERSE